MEAAAIKSTGRIEAECIWRRLEAAVKPGSLAARWEWVEIWLRTYGDLIPHEFLVGSVNGSAGSICLVTKQTGRFLPFPVTCYHIGPGGEPIKDRIQMLNNCLLSLPQRKQEFIQELVAALIRRYSLDELRLDFFAEDDVNAFAGALKNAGIPYKVVKEAAYVYDLRQARLEQASIIDTFGKSTRQELKRTLKGLGANLDSEVASTLPEAMDIYTELKQLHQLSWVRRGKRGMFSSRRFTAFHRELIQQLFDEGILLLFRLKSRYGTVGCLYGFVENNCLLGYQSGFADFSGCQIPNINPKRIHSGCVTHLLCMQACLERGLDEYNFGPAEYRYKSQMTNSVKDIWSLSARFNAKPAIRDAVWNLYIMADKQKAAHTLLQPFYRVYKALTQ